MRFAMRKRDRDHEVLVQIQSPQANLESMKDRNQVLLKTFLAPRSEDINLVMERKSTLNSR